MTDPQAAVEAFIERWSPTGGGERSNYQLFLNQLCDLIGAPKPECGRNVVEVAETVDEDPGHQSDHDDVER